MKSIHALALNVSALLLLAACNNDKPERDPTDWRTPQYIEDSTITSNYVRMMDTILLNLPAGMKATDQCPANVKNRVQIFKDGQMYMLFEPKELYIDSSYISFFRYTKVQKDLSPGHVFFPWAQLRESGFTSQQEVYFNVASAFREVIANKYICIFVNNLKEYIRPQLDSIKDEFTPGKISGTAIIVDFTTGKPQCAFPVEAFSSDSVSVETQFDHGEYSNSGVLGELATMASRDGVVVDLWYNLATEIERKLRE